MSESTEFTDMTELVPKGPCHLPVVASGSLGALRDMAVVRELLTSELSRDEVLDRINHRIRYLEEFQRPRLGFPVWRPF